MPTELPRVTFTISADELDAIHEYWHNNKIRNQSQAILSLIRLGLDEVNNQRMQNGEIVITDAKRQLMDELFAKLDDADRADLYRHGQLMLLQDKYK